MNYIPVIDFSDIHGQCSENTDCWTKKAEQLKQAFSGIGFFYLTNHGIDKSIVSVHQWADNIQICGTFFF